MSVLTAFNNHFMEFLEDIQSIFPEDRDIKKAITSLTLLRKGNPKLILVVWKQYITHKYKSQIDQGDISFFLEKDYSDDIETSNSSRILESIDRLRGPISNMGAENQKKAMKYIQNLTKLSEMYA
jgi:hypothetical protein